MQAKGWLLLSGLMAGMAGFAATEKPVPATWDRQGAAKYLDAREIWWQGWPRAERDRDTVCISCHTVVPYALARPGLRGAGQLTAPEERMLGDVKKRVGLWAEVEPFYSDTPERETGSRNSEAVLNALILASYDARSGTRGPLTQKAFDGAWAVQEVTGKDAGGWVWLNFHNAPWEGEESPYQGATFAALAAGLEGPQFLEDARNRGHLELLRGYLQHNYSEQPLANKAMFLWAASRLPGWMAKEQKVALAEELLALQQADGGWSLNALGRWKRRDDTPIETVSDGYATGLVLLAVQGVVPEKDARLERGAAFLRANQDRDTGAWAAYSLNKKRDPATDAGKFMSDAATAYAAMALEAYEGERNPTSK